VSAQTQTSVSVSHRLCLGTAQFGMRYGIANQGGQVTRAAAVSILGAARRAGINSLDTAIAYGNSESALGEIGVADWRITTKLPALPSELGDVGEWARAQTAASFARLRVARVHGILLHRPADLLGPFGTALAAVLEELVRAGLTERVGVSIYEPGELDALRDRLSIGIVQSPFNVLDRRLETSGWLARLVASGVEVHTRSAFLQGLLVMSPSQRPAWTAPWAAELARWDGWLADRGLSATRACLALAISRPEIARVVVGVDSLDQLQALLTDTAVPTEVPPLEFALEDARLLNPALWPKV
jgi:aryl-alcohol dehydrogenase-like predicted oxidoreductase